MQYLIFKNDIKIKKIKKKKTKRNPDLTYIFIWI